MLPLTLDRPKPTLPVLGRPLIVPILHGLRRQGVDRVVINLHHLPDLVRRAVAQGACDQLPAVSFIHEPEILGTAGALRNAADLLRGDGPIVVCNSDFLADIELAAVIRAHAESGALATLVLAPWRAGYSRIERDAAGWVTALGAASGGARGDGGFLFTGLHVIDPALLGRIPASGPSDVVRDVYRALAEEGRLSSCVHDGFWWEFGSPELYLEGSLVLIDLPADRLRRIAADHDPLRRIGEARAAVGPGADIHPSASLAGRAALGSACRIGEKAHLQDAVVMAEAWIGPTCRLERVIVAEGVELPVGFEAQDAVILTDPGRTVPPPSGAARRTHGLQVHPLATGT
jgi:mannose-1-phosphate guanylyltransferase